MYNEAANLLGHQRQVAFNNQVTTSDAFDYTYDGFGRMAQRRVRDSAVSLVKNRGWEPQNAKKYATDLAMDLRGQSIDYAKTNGLIKC
ncbi:MAG: hypothetical protein RR510_03595 [Morganella sp. (in: enterobacteria)]